MSNVGLGTVGWRDPLLLPQVKKEKRGDGGRETEEAFGYSFDAKP